MNQKELKEKLKYIPEDKYIYQRHDGIIYKYIDTGDYYISCETGMSCASGSCLLGKVEDNLIDLIEVGDYVNGLRVEYITNEAIFTSGLAHGILFEDIRTVVTKEQFESIEYKVEEE